MSYKLGIVLGFIFLSLAIFSAPTEAAYWGQCVNAEISDISPTSVRVGEEFTVGVHIENCGEELPESVSFEIISLPVDITVKEPLSTEVSKLLCSSSERFLKYHMAVSDDALPGTYVLKTKLTYQSGQFSTEKNYSITVDVIGDKAELNIASIKTKPVLPYEGDTVALTMRIENFGEGTANSVRTYLDHSFQGLKESFIGTLDADEDGPAVFTFIADKAGEFEFPVTIGYKDDFGTKEMQTDINLIVLEKERESGDIIFSAAIVVLVILLVVYYFKSKRDKNKLIHQLLRGNAEHKISAKKKK